MRPVYRCNAPPFGRRTNRRANTVFPATSTPSCCNLLGLRHRRFSGDTSRTAVGTLVSLTTPAKPHDRRRLHTHLARTWAPHSKSIWRRRQTPTVLRWSSGSSSSISSSSEDVFRRPSPTPAAPRRRRRRRSSVHSSRPDFYFYFYLDFLTRKFFNSKFSEISVFFF